MVKCNNCKNLETKDNGFDAYSWCEKINDCPHEDIERDCEHYAPITNADRIRSMTDEELAEVLFGSCIEHMGVEECSHPEEACKSCVLDWLRAESEE